MLTAGRQIMGVVMTDIVVKSGLIDYAGLERLLISLPPDVAAGIDG